MRDLATEAAPHVTGLPCLTLRGEGAAQMLAAASLYAAAGGDWRLFAALFLLPDLAILAYLRSNRAGAIIYNCAHSLIGPALLGSLGVAGGSNLAQVVALVWIAHIGFDRMLGYGLKYPSAFSHTHLGIVGVLVVERVRRSSGAPRNMFYAVIARVDRKRRAMRKEIGPFRGLAQPTAASIAAAWSAVVSKIGTGLSFDPISSMISVYPRITPRAPSRPGAAAPRSLRSRTTRAGSVRMRSAPADPARPG